MKQAMNDFQLEIFNTHDWGMKKIRSHNSFGEPVYVTLCKNCDRLVSEVQKSWVTCESKGTDDKRPTRGVS